MAGLPAAPQVTEHCVLAAQVTWQSPSHLTLHVEDPEQVAVLAVPSWSLQVALVSHVAIEAVPSLKSQFVLDEQVTRLALPPIPLHADESLHVTVSASSELPLHLADWLHASEQASSPHSVLQSVPAVQVQAVSAHTHPVPAHVGPPPPQPPASAIEIPRMTVRMRCMGIHSRPDHARNDAHQCPFRRPFRLNRPGVRPAATDPCPGYRANGDGDEASDRAILECEAMSRGARCRNRASTDRPLPPTART